jgi:hypothetical protein
MRIVPLVTGLALITSLAAPAFALATEGSVEAEATVQTTEGKPAPGQPRPLLRKIEGLRAENRLETATTTRALMRDSRETERQEHSATSTEKRSFVKEARETMIDRLKEHRTEIKGRLKAEAANGLNRVIEVFSSMLSNLSSIDARIDAHIQTLESKGATDTAPAKDASQKAKDAISVATKAIDDAHASMLVAASSTDPKAHLPEMKTAVKAAQDAVRAARSSIEAAIKSLRALKIESSASLDATSSH